MEGWKADNGGCGVHAVCVHAGRIHAGRHLKQSRFEGWDADIFAVIILGVVAFQIALALGAPWGVILDNF